MANIRTIDKIARKWATVTPGRTADYEEGIQNPRRDWEQSTAAASDSWSTGVQQAIADKRFEKGVRTAGTDKWQQASLEKGVQRWGPGVAIGESNYARGFAPIRDAIERCQLPPRFARRDPRNLARVKAIVDCVVLAATRAS